MKEKRKGEGDGKEGKEKVIKRQITQLRNPKFSTDITKTISMIFKYKILTTYKID